MSEMLWRRCGVIKATSQRRVMLARGGAVHNIRPFRAVMSPPSLPLRHAFAAPLLLRVMRRGKALRRVATGY